MPRMSVYWLAVPALVCVAAAPAAHAISVDSQAYLGGVESRNRDKAQRIQRRLAEIESQQISAADKAKAKDDFLKKEVEKAETDQRAAAQFGGQEGQAIAAEVTALLKALREQERWEAARGGPNADAPNRAEKILLDGAGQAALDEYTRTKAEIEARNRRMNEDAARDDARRLQEYEEQERRKKAEDAELRRRTSMANPQSDGSIDESFLFVDGSFGRVVLDDGPGFLGYERVGTTDRRLGIVQPDTSSDSAWQARFSTGWDTTGSIEPLRLWPSTVPAQTWIHAGGQYAEFERRSTQDILDVGPNHRILIPGTGDPFSVNREGFSIGPGGGFNLVRDIAFAEDTDAWTVWGKVGQTNDYGSWRFSSYGLAAYSQTETDQVFSGRLPNVPPTLDFRYDTKVDTSVASFGLGAQAEVPIDAILGGMSSANNLSIMGGALVTADFIQSEGRDQLRVERPGFFVDTQFVDMRETNVEAGYEVNLGLRYRATEHLAIDLGGRFGSHKTGIGIERLGTQPSQIEHLREDVWSVGVGVTWKN